jgi:hypothetical protein
MRNWIYLFFLKGRYIKKKKEDINCNVGIDLERAWSLNLNINSQNTRLVWVDYFY